jgi:hypothetical protein
MKERNTQKKQEEKTKKTINYNDRLDGYGAGEAESGGEDRDLREKYGELDQYSFRSPPIKKEETPEKTPD